MKSKKRKGTIHSVDPVLFQRYLNSQPDHVLATLISEFGFKPSMMFKSSALWKHFIKWQKTDGKFTVEVDLSEGLTTKKGVDTNKVLYNPFVASLPNIEEIKLEESEKMEHDSDYDPYESQG